MNESMAEQVQRLERELVEERDRNEDASRLVLGAWIDRDAERERADKAEAACAALIGAPSVSVQRRLATQMGIDEIAKPILDELVRYKALHEAELGVCQQHCDVVKERCQELDRLRERADQAQAACAAKDSALESAPHLADHLIRAERETDRSRMLAHLDHAQIIIDKVNAARSPNPGQPIRDELARLRGVVERLRKRCGAEDILRHQGGDWLGALRGRVQTMFHNGDRVTWETQDLLRPQATMRNVEELGEIAVMADRREVLRMLAAADAAKEHT